jgi:ABC-2 type transport system permease protein
MSTPGEPILLGRDIHKAFRRETGEIVAALDGVSLQAEHGSLTALVGPDGAGKTTLIRLIAGLMQPDSGLLHVLGIDVAADPQQVQSRIGYMPQRFGLYEDLTVQENLDLYADMHGVGKAERRRRYPQLMDMTALGPFTQRLAGRLSGGMKQKLGLACTLIRRPELLLLDEPTVGVDPVSRRELWDIVLQLVQHQDLTVLVSTSYLDEAERCRHAIVLHQGRVLAQGPPTEISRTAAGRTFIIEPPQGQTARQLQSGLLSAPGVVDAVPQAGHVRVVLESRDHEDAVDGLTMTPVEPRFEDGFMVLLRQHLAAHAEAGLHTTRLVQSPHAADPRASSDPIVEVHDLVRRFGHFIAVDHVSFSVRQGEIFGLLGPNGAGKTTTFRMMCGLLPVSEGTLRVAGVDLRHARASARQRIGYVAQKYSLYGQISVIENLEFFASAYGLRGARKRERIQWALEQFELEAFTRLDSGQLPGGYKQRLAMAAALLHEPDVLFLDEPTSGADPLARREFWARINELADQGVTVIITTHSMEESEYCDRIAIMDAGRVLIQGTPAEVRRHAHPEAGHTATMEDAFLAIVAEARGDVNGRRGERENGRSTDSFSDPAAVSVSPSPRLPFSLSRNLAEKLRRILALVRKETRQIVRDPSSIAIGVILPVILIVLFGYGLSLDVKDVPVAIAMEEVSPEAIDLASAFQLSPYFQSRVVTSMARAEQLLRDHEVDGIVQIRSDFARHLMLGDAEVQIIVQGTDANRARIIQAYAQGAIGQWSARRAAEGHPALAGPVVVRDRLWFNEADDSHYFLVPGLIVLVMTLIGAMLTSLVMAREWERGTMEALFVTPVRVGDILLGKTIPYFLLGMIGLGLCIVSARFVFHVPVRGSMIILAGASTLYLLVALGVGLLISSWSKSQFVATQVTLLVTFLPAMMLSGFLFDLRSMPAAVRLITYLLPARYYVALLQTAFLAGNIWSVIIPNAAVLTAMAVGLLLWARAVTQKKLA